ncbi:MAG: hypothetical protein WAZ77_07110, partial [Candidatus Nitrosopolaris sp.]
NSTSANQLKIKSTGDYHDKPVTWMSIACFSNDTGNVIPTFSVLSLAVVPIILVPYVVPSRAIYLSLYCHYF